jgi:hypothetical protein
VPLTKPGRPDPVWTGEPGRRAGECPNGFVAERNSSRTANPVTNFPYEAPPPWVRASSMLPPNSGRRLSMYSRDRPDTTHRSPTR